MSGNNERTPRVDGALPEETVIDLRELRAQCLQIPGKHANPSEVEGSGRYSPPESEGQAFARAKRFLT